MFGTDIGRKPVRATGGIVKAKVNRMQAIVFGHSHMPEFTFAANFCSRTLSYPGKYRRRRPRFGSDAGVPSPSSYPRAMQGAYPQFVRTDETSPQTWRPQGWSGRFYRLFNRLRFVRKELRLTEDVFMVQTDFLEGHIKVGGAIAPGRLTIGFYHDAKVSRLSGRALDTKRMAISYNGCVWDAVSRAPASGVAIHFAEAPTRTIVSERAHAFLMETGRASTGARLAHVSRQTMMGEKLDRAIRSSIDMAEHDDGSLEGDKVSAWINEDLLTLASCLIDDVVEGESDYPGKGEANRYELAIGIEKLLWIDPEMAATPSVSLDDVASIFGCSRRQVQMAILEHFGVGFTELKRCIRLHQAFNAVNEKQRYQNISAIAQVYEFDHLGRFAKYYRELFGILPSDHLRDTWRRSAPGS
jgi:AraC-like DNA-binding protein